MFEFTNIQSIVNIQIMQQQYGHIDKQIKYKLRLSE